MKWRLNLKTLLKIVKNICLNWLWCYIKFLMFTFQSGQGLQNTTIIRLNDQVTIILYPHSKLKGTSSKVRQNYILQNKRQTNAIINETFLPKKTKGRGETSMKNFATESTTVENINNNNNKRAEINVERYIKQAQFSRQYSI